MKPGRYDVKVFKGTKFDVTFTWKDGDGNPRDVTNYTAEARFNAFGPSAEVDASVTVGGIDGQFRVVLTAAQTQDIEWELGEWYLNIAAPGDDMERFLYGVVNGSD